jgi:hypothetical protein
MCGEDYDSAADTLAHSQLVGRYMGAMITELVERSYEHDASKLAEPEKSAFDRCTERLRTLTYGSDEYKASLAELGPALEHHYTNNRHHPEHHDSGITGMTLMDLCEMLADWYAAGQRHADGDLGRSLVVQQDRFAIGDQLMDILENTARHLRWLKE